MECCVPNQATLSRKECFGQIERPGERQTGWSPVVVSRKQEGGCFNNEVRNHFSGSCMEHHMTIAHCTQQNGNAERRPWMLLNFDLAILGYKKRTKASGWNLTTTMYPGNRATSSIMSTIRSCFDFEKCNCQVFHIFSCFSQILVNDFIEIDWKAETPKLVSNSLWILGAKQSV